MPRLLALFALLLVACSGERPGSAAAGDVVDAAAAADTEDAAVSGPDAPQAATEDAAEDTAIGAADAGGDDAAAGSADADATAAPPCLQVTPAKPVNFGAVLLGFADKRTIVLGNCGSADLLVESVAYVTTTSVGEFGLDWSSAQQQVPTLDPLTGPTASAPLVLPPGTELDFQITYKPADAPPDFTPDSALLRIQAQGAAAKDVPVTALGVLANCPQAKAIVKQGNVVVPQTALQLKGDLSTAVNGGAIQKYQWTVTQPAGSNQPLLPNAGFPNPTMTVNAAGKYVFCLDVWDQLGEMSCVPSCVEVEVVPGGGMHVELLWDTPTDPDQTDYGPAAGADLDLHFAHGKAAMADVDCDGQPDPWFDKVYDAYWFNPNPEWGASGKADDPSLDLDDTDGAGPENLNLQAPEPDPVSYAIGAHYWHDHGYGKSLATVRIYLWGALIVEVAKVALNPCDLWYVGRVTWPAGSTGAPAIDLCHQTGHPCLTQAGKPGGGKMWQPAGDWCIRPSYAVPLAPPIASSTKPACPPWP